MKSTQIKSMVSLYLLLAMALSPFTAGVNAVGSTVKPSTNRAATRPDSKRESSVGPVADKAPAAAANASTSTLAGKVARPREAFGKLPLSFEPNLGQPDSSGDFFTNYGRNNVSLSRSGVVFSSKASSPPPDTSSPVDYFESSKGAEARVKMVFLEGNPNLRLEGLDELPGKTNYYLGNDPTKWRVNIPNYAAVKYVDIYSGVDAIFYGNQRQLEYDFVVSPGVDPNVIKLGFEGAERASIDGRGDLVLQVAGGEMRHAKPIIYQEVNGKRQHVDGRYKLTPANEVTFEIANYDREKSLIIDPVFVYSTYFGGLGEDLSYGIAVDSGGSAYITGSAFAQGQKGFVAKLNPTGTALSYLTYFGGNGVSVGYAVAVDTFGSAVLTGYTTASNFPTVGALQSNRRGWANAFVTRLTPAGALAASTYFGGSDSAPGHGEFGMGIGLDGAGNVYIGGESTSGDLPVLNAYQPVKGGVRDSFLVKLNPTLSALAFCTYLGGSNTEGGNPTADSNSTRPGNRLAVDAAGNVYVTGYTFSSNLPVINALQPNKRGEADAYVGKFSPAGVPIYITYLGGTGTGNDFAHGDYAYAIACDASGNAYLAGDTTSTNFPTVNAIRAVKSGARDIFVTKINSQGTAILYSTYLGGSNGNETADGIAVDAAGRAFVTGLTLASDFPTTNLLQPARGGGEDAFLCRLNASGSALDFSSYVGGSSGDSGSGVAVDEAGNAYLTGWTVSTNFPTSAPLQPSNGGQQDGFIAKIDSVIFSVIAIQSNRGGNTGDVSAAIIGGGFESGATVKLRAANQPDIAGTNPIVNNSSNLTATFDLRGAAVGPRDVVVTQPDGRTATLANGFTVEVEQASQLWVDIIGPQIVRQGREQIFTIVYGNRGNINAPAPLLELSSPDPVKFAFFGARALQVEPLRIFAAGHPGSAGMVPPGSFSLQVKVVPPASLGPIRLDLSMVETTGHAFDWNQLAASGAPAGADPADWSARVNQARSVIGESLDSVMTVLRNGATESGQDAQAFYDFDNFLRYTVGSYGSNENEFSSGGSANTPQNKRRTQAGSPGAKALLTSSPPAQLITIAERENPTETFVLTPGLGGLRGFDGTRTDFFEAAAALQRTHPNSNIYILDTTESMNPPVSGPLKLFAAAANIPRAGNAGFELLKAKGTRFFNPANAVFVGESFGNSVNNQTAKRFSEDGAKVARAFILNPANLLGFPTELKAHFQHSIAISSNSWFDTQLKFADYNPHLVTDTLNQVKQHTSGIGRLRDHPELVDLFFDPNLHAFSNPLSSDGAIRLDGTYDPASFSILISLVLNRDLFPLRLLLKRLPVTVVASRDPNDKVGAAGATTLRYVSGDEPLRYIVFFENVEAATAAAQEVVIKDQLDLSRVDPKSFVLGPITIGNRLIIPPLASSDFTGTIDLRPANNLIVKVVAGLNQDTGLATWKFTSLDPATGLPTSDPLAGFLPPNTNPPDGEGSVFFTVSPKPELPTGTEVLNQASIVFDENAAIQTPSWLNTLDNSSPASNVLPLSALQSSNTFNVQWRGTDLGSGIKDYTVFVSQDGQPYTIWLANVTATAATFTGQEGSVYAFYSLARDLTDNHEATKTVAEASTTIASGADLSITNVASSNSVVTGSSVTYTLTVTNHGPGAAAAVTVVNTLPAATALVSCSATGGQLCGGSGNVSTVNFPTLAPGASETVTIVANLQCSAADGTAINNLAAVSAATTDPNANDNSAAANVSASNPPPVISCPADIVRPNDAGLGSAVVNYPMPTVTDNCSTPVISCSRASGSTFPVGTTPVICTATDSAGSQSTCPFTVTVTDNEAPKITQCAVNRSLSTGGSNQIALPNLTDEIIATDNFTAPAALTIIQSPPAGTMIGVGNTPVTITVKDAANNAATCTATITVLRFSLSDFVVLSREFTQLLENVRVISGSVGTAASLPDPNGPPDEVEEVEIGNHVQMLQSGTSVVGDTVRLRSNAQVQNVFFNELYNTHGDIFGGRFTPLSLPAITLPAIPPITPGMLDIEVQVNQVRTLAPGRYRKITVKNRGTLILIGGVYDVSSLDIREDTNILFKGPAEVRVKNEMDTDARTYIGPDSSAPTLKASQIVFYAEGPDDRGRHHDEDKDLSPTVVQIGQRNTVLMNVLAPNGTVWLKNNTKATGSFVGKRARIGEGVELKLSSAF